jgi:tetratricopeptide (TPR) repeat protein
VPSVPDTVQEAIAARINLLEPQAKRLLQAAAVIGPEVPAMLLGPIADLPEQDVRRRLLELQAAEIFLEKAGAPEPAYSFKHALIQEAVCEALLEEQRRALHARIVQVIERLHAGRLGEHVERLAYHAFNAQTWGKAVAYLRHAGAKAAARSAHLEAAACYEQALAALAHLPESRERTEQAIDVRFELRTSLHLLGEFDRILEHLRQAQTLAESLDERSRSGWVSSYLMQHFRHTGDQTSALEAGRRALAIAQDLGDSALQVTTHTHLGVVYGTLGQYRRAVDMLRGNVQSLAGPRGRERFGMVGLPAVLSSGFLAWYLAELGEFPEAIARSEEAVAIAESANDPYSLAIASNLAGVVAVLKGAPAQAIHTLERALDLCRAMRFRILLPPATCWLGAAYTLTGRPAEAVPLIKQAVEAAVSMKRMDRYAIFLVRLGEAHVQAGRPDWASEPAERALQLARRQGERGHEAYALRLLADIASRGNVDEKKAQTGYLEAKALAEQLGMRPLVAHCHLGLGRLYRRAENPTRAAAPFEAAAVLYREMDMRHWLAQVEAETRSALLWNK